MSQAERPFGRRAFGRFFRRGSFESTTAVDPQTQAPEPSNNGHQPAILRETRKIGGIRRKLIYQEEKDLGNHLQKNPHFDLSNLS